MDSRPVVSYGKYLMVWLSLLVLTVTTITAAALRFGKWSVMAAILIATVKGTLVLLYFMHLKYESRVFLGMLMIAVLTLAIIMVLTFADVSFR